MKWSSRNNRQIYVLLAPGLLFVFIFAGYGLLMALIESLQYPDQQGWTLEYYGVLFAERIFWDSLWLSLRVTLLSTLLSLFIGLVLTGYLYHYFLKEKWKLMIWLPMLIPHFVAGYLVLFFFSQSGWLSALCFQLGLITDRQEFPIFVMDRQGIGMVLAYVWKEVPFVVLMLLPVYYQLDHRYKDVVHTLGGGRWQAFRTAEWPWLCVVVIETGMIIFAFVFAAFELPYLLGVTYPKMLPLLAFDWFSAGDWSMRPLAMAVMMVTTTCILLFAFLSFRYSQSIRYKMMREGAE